jgi:hypothetical protein
LIQSEKDVDRRFVVGDTPQAQSTQASVLLPRLGPDAQKAAALVRLVERMGLMVNRLGIHMVIARIFSGQSKGTRAIGKEAGLR